ncbi:TPA: hypothetical protein QCU33_005359 [Bacillus cereus]|nr:hypothetical protein [Bacillus cereus]
MKVNSKSKELFLGCTDFPTCRHTERID